MEILRGATTCPISTVGQPPRLTLNGGDIRVWHDTGTATVCYMAMSGCKCVQSIEFSSVTLPFITNDDQPT